MLKKYHALDKDGLARVGEALNDGDAFVYKGVPDAATLQLLEQP
jgi:DNA-directed RNA polymerase beta subunit